MRMSPLALVVISDLVTFVLSMFITLFVAGVRWGEVRRDLAAVKDDVKEIKGMFVLRLRDDNQGK